MRIIFAIIALALVVSPGVASAKQGPATAAVRGANKEISKLLAIEVEPGSAEEQKVASRVTDSVRGFLDVDALGKLALRDHWDGLNEAQRTEFLALLRELVERNYIKGLRANLQYEVAYTGEARQDDRVVVTTQIKTRRKGRPVKIGIDYALAKDDGTWRAFDVITDGVGLVENYRAQFNRIIDKEGFDGLLSRMKKRRDALR